MSTYNNPLKIEEIGTGEQAGTWGDTTNVNIADALPEAITGRAAVTMTDADYTLPYVNSNAPQEFRNLVLNVTSSGNLSTTRNLIIPAINKQYIVENNTSGSQSIVVKTAAGSGITVPNGRKAHLFCDGTTTRFADDFVDINGGTIDGVTLNVSTASFDTINVGTQASKATISYTTNAARTLTVPAVSGNRTFAFIDEAQTFTANQSFNTLLVGTQTNKATISYTTDAARTLTIPAVSGNRTFAFLEEIQTFTASQTFTANQTIGANLTFTGNQRRLQAPFNSQTTNAFLLQNSGTNTGTAVGIIPNGTSREAAVILNSSTDPANTNYLVLYASDIQTRLDSDSVGTGVTQRLRLDTDNFERITIMPTGECSVNDTPNVNVSLKIAASGRIYSLQADNKVAFPDAYGNTVGATNRSLYIDSTGLIGGLSSTRESKTNIVPIADADWLMSLEPVSYNRRLKNDKDAYTDTANPTTEFGLIADDVANVRPEICVFVKGKVSGINYEQLIAPMLKEIQKLRAEVNALKEKVNG
jgi:hypothetical protein